jgi:hypothetical protein
VICTPGGLLGVPETFSKKFVRFSLFHLHVNMRIYFCLDTLQPKQHEVKEDLVILFVQPDIKEI